MRLEFTGAAGVLWQPDSTGPTVECGGGNDLVLALARAEPASDHVDDVEHLGITIPAHQ